MSQAERAGAPGGGPLDRSDLGRLLALLEECEAAPDLQAFRQAIVESFARHFGFRHATCFVGRTLPEVFADRQPVVSGRAEQMANQYIEAAHRQDPFAQPFCVPMYRGSGVVSLDQLKPLARRPASQRYLDGFLFRNRIHAKLVVPLATDQGVAGVGLLAEESGAFGARELAVARLAGRHLTNLFRFHVRQLAGAALSGPPALSRRQAQVVRLIAQGKTNRQVSQELFITVDTVKKHLTKAMELTGCTNRTQLAMMWRRATGEEVSYR